MSNYIEHHGILGQRWGKRNGPPYPLSGGSYSVSEKKEIYKARLKRNSIYNKKHFDKTIKEGKTISTLSYDKDRTKNTDMFYSTYEFSDKHLYNALFNKKVSSTIYDDDGTSLGTTNCYKFKNTK